MDDPRDLKRAQFEELLQRLHEDRDRAGVAYEQIRRKLIKFFECNSCPHSEDLADETLNRVARKLSGGEVGDVAAFAWGVAKNILLEARKKNLKLVRLSELPKGENSLVGEQDPEKEIQKNVEDEKKIGCLLLCMQRLSADERKLFLAYYNVSTDRTEYRQKLAKSWGLNIGNLRVRMNRLRGTLENCVRKCTGSWGAAAWRSPARLE